MKTLLLYPFFLNLPALAEYRVFDLRIYTESSSRSMASTLDPLQYKEYYPLQSNEKIEYTDTWMCKGRTNNYQDLCPNPRKAQIPEKEVSIQNTP